MFKDLIPWRKKKDENALTFYRDFEHPFSLLNRDMNELFDNFFSDTERLLKTPFKLTRQDNWFTTPDLDVVENDKEIVIKADLPGLDEKDVQVNLDGDSITIKGEKYEEKEDKKGRYHIAERRSGSFSRTIPVDSKLIEQDKIKASFKKGVLKLTLPKIPGKKPEKKQIDIAVEED